jgi:hypothetical protein
MNTKYSNWIAANVTAAYGRCDKLTQQMAESFPELTRVRGHYHCVHWGERAHWWLVAPDGAIVDPTAGQFPSKGRGPYVPWDESQPEPTGMCPNCGGSVYNGGTVCSDVCAHEFAASCLLGVYA